MFWRFRAGAQVILARRDATARLLPDTSQPSKPYAFILDPNCELYTICDLIKESTSMYGTVIDSPRWYHITWGKGP